MLLACDLPFVEPPILRLLADWPGTDTVIPVVDGRLQYACARYGPDALERAEAALLAGDHSLRAAAGDDHDELTEAQWRAVGPANTFADVDTPADLRRLGLSAFDRADAAEACRRVRRSEGAMRTVRTQRRRAEGRRAAAREP